MTHPQQGRWLNTCGYLFILMLLPSVAGQAFGQTAETSSSDHEILTEGGGLAERAVAAVIGHPNVSAARANICSAASNFDLATSRQYPQITFDLQGGSSLSSNITRRDTLSRRFDDDAIDAVVRVNQVLYDWGVIEADKQIALNDAAAQRLGMHIQIDRVAADIVDLAMRIAENRDQAKLYADYAEDLAPIGERVEAGVNAGVTRIGDLRAYKVIELDAQIQLTLANRQISLNEAELSSRFALDASAALALFDRFRLARPETPPDIASETIREIRRLDFEIQSNIAEVGRLEAEKKPQFTGQLNTTFFDIDGFSEEYEMTGQVRFSMPLYVGGSNAARQAEAKWQGRSLDNQRDDLIRQHRNQVENVIETLRQARERRKANDEKMAELVERLEEAQARQGQTESDPLSVTRLMEQIAQLEAEQISLTYEVEGALLRGVFFADRLGDVLSLPYGGPQC
ncbi:TolC family protein [Alphaproteobacteria bacterium LSUCC0684]